MLAHTPEVSLYATFVVNEGGIAGMMGCDPIADILAYLCMFGIGAVILV